ncbi:MAG TPA: penicillin acylase family protein [Dermatophilaceae bacterium]|nr:penicillin acylase family protein [Dermatophilaceae bacterium]
MSRRPVLRRVLVGLVAALVVLAVVVSVVGLSFARRSLPQTSGEATVPGLEGRVTVLRDDRGIPQIYGDSMTDIARAQGYVHAQDRFFEMDLRRHVTSGRLSELVGAPRVETDRLIRTMGWRRVAEAELPTLRPETRRFLQAYADGVNAYLRGRSPAAVSLEYLVLSRSVPGYGIEEWTPADSVAWLKAMAWDLRSDYDDELARARLSARMAQSQINQLYPAYDFGAYPPILSGADWSPQAAGPVAGSVVPPALTARPASGGPAAGADTAALTSASADRLYAGVSRTLRSLPSLVGRGEGIGSNSWVVSGSRTSTGKPLLANDMHLGVGIPGIWYQVGLHCRTVSRACPLEVAGFSFAGVPGVVIGHNATIAWGFTNLAPDVSDFYLERVNRRGQFLRDGEWTELVTRTERIRVAGEADRTITVRSTGHGPLLSDVSAGVAEAGSRAPTTQRRDGEQAYAVSLAWTGLVPGKTADAVLAMNLASTFEEFRAAASSFAVPAQNLVYADVGGTIGYQTPGLVPIRRAALPGAPPGYWPAPGWDSDFDWKGYVPFESMPWVQDPAAGYLVTANQAVTQSARPFLTTEWDAGMRASRIRERLEALDTVRPADMASIQMDTDNVFAPTLVKALLEVDLDDDFTAGARDLLRDWSFTNPDDASSEAAAAAYYNAVWANLVRLLFNDELPADLQRTGGSRDRQAVTVLLKTPRSVWWDDKQTPSVTEGKDEILRQALVEARLELTRKVSKDPGDWQWSKLHQLDLAHPVLGGTDLPGPVRWVFNRGGYRLPGDSAVVNANGWDVTEGYGVTWAPSMRMVVDLADLDASTWVNSTGASGHAQSSHYDDQVEDWAAGRQRRWAFSEAAVREAAEDTLTLVPAAG